MVFAVGLMAQVEVPASSPQAKLEQKVGLTDITIEYNRPGMKNRKIFGDLVPFGSMWRTGANASTKITFSDDVMVEGEKLEKGTYALYSVPGEVEWEFIFYKDLSHWGVPRDYDETQEALRITVDSEEMPWTFETMIFDINNVRDASATVQLLWESTVVGFDITLNTDEKVEASISKVLAGPDRGDYYSAARYYFSNDKDLEQALAWIKKANELDAKFWQVRLEALIQSKLGNKTEAIAAATKSMMMAEEAGNMDYVRMNKASIAEWTSEDKMEEAPAEDE
jgi:hypothetical protein